MGYFDNPTTRAIHIFGGVQWATFDNLGAILLSIFYFDEYNCPYMNHCLFFYIIDANILPKLNYLHTHNLIILPNRTLFLRV